MDHSQFKPEPVSYLATEIQSFEFLWPNLFWPKLKIWSVVADFELDLDSRLQEI